MDDLIIEYSVRSALDGTFVCQPPTVRYRWINPAAFGGHRIIMAPPDSVRFIGESLYFMRVDSGMSEDEAARLAESDVVTDDQAPPQPEDKEELWNASDVRKSAVGAPERPNVGASTRYSRRHEKDPAAYVPQLWRSLGDDEIVSY